MLRWCRNLQTIIPQANNAGKLEWQCLRFQQQRNLCATERLRGSLRIECC